MLLATEAWNTALDDDPQRKAYALLALHLATQFPSMLTSVPDEPDQLVFDPLRERVFAVGPQGVTARNLASSHPISPLIPNGQVHSITKGSFSVDGRWFVGFFDPLQPGTPRLHLIDYNSQRGRVLDDGGMQELLGISSDGAAIIFTDGRIDLATGKPSRTLRAVNGRIVSPQAPLKSFTFSSARDWIIRTEEGSARVTDLRNSSPPVGAPSSLNSSGEVVSAALSEGGRFAALCLRTSAGYTLKLWDLLNSRSVETELLKSASSVEDISTDGRLVVASILGNPVVLDFVVWRTGGPQVQEISYISAAEPTAGLSFPHRSIARFSPDGALLWILRSAIGNRSSDARREQRWMLEAWYTNSLTQAGQRIYLPENVGRNADWQKSRLRFAMH